jgi:phosphoglycolate phosphatase
VKYDLVIFDLDGTLIDSQKDLASAVNLTRCDFGLKPITLDEVRHCVGNGLRVLVEKSIPEISQEKVDEALAILNKHYTEHLTDNTYAYEGMAETLKALACKKAVLTNKPFRFTESLLKFLGWDGLFDAVVGGDTLPIRKPDPKTIFEILKRTNTAPEKAIMVGDGVNDVKTAKAAGIDSCLALYGYTDPQTAKTLSAKYEILKPKDLLKVLA